MVGIGGHSIVSRSVAKIINRTNNCGGNKKAGLPPLIGQSQPNRNHIKINAFPRNGQKFVISSVNQLGGIGRTSSMVRVPADGVNKSALMRMRFNCNIACNNCGSVIKPVIRSI